MGCALFFSLDTLDFDLPHQAALGLLTHPGPHPEGMGQWQGRLRGSVEAAWVESRSTGLCSTLPTLPMGPGKSTASPHLHFPP